MEVKDVKRDGAWVRWTANELLIVCNALNEVCNGIEVPEFATRMGAERQEVLHLLSAVGDLYDQVAKQP